MLVADFQGQIVFIDKLLYISKRVVTTKSKKNRFDADGKAMAKTMYAIAFHYDNGETSQITYFSEQERDDDYNKFLAGDLLVRINKESTTSGYVHTDNDLEPPSYETSINTAQNHNNITCPNCGSNMVVVMYGSITLNGKTKSKHCVCIKCHKEFDVED